METKNGAVIRKHMGYGYIDAAHAEPIQHFYVAAPQPLSELPSPLRPSRGRSRRERPPTLLLPALPDARWRRCWPCLSPHQYLREGLTVAALQRIAAAVSDTEAAQRMQQAKRKLFEQLRPGAQGPWK